MGRRTARSDGCHFVWIAVEGIDDGSSIAMADFSNLTPEKHLG
ncbi:hypothetical protein [Lysinibacillus fusiformis]|nr:hypothetical protein [Lysinibacillus fusiformis]